MTAPMMQTQLPKDKDRKWEDFKNRLSYVKDTVDSRYLLESLGIQVQRESSKELRCSCVIHGGDNPTSFRFNRERKTWVCFSHKCHEIFGNDVIGLIKAVNKVEFMEAVTYLMQLVGDVDSVAALQYRKERERKDFIDSNKKEKYVHPNVTDEKLSHYSWLRSQFFNDEGFSNKTLDYYEIAGGYKKDGLIRDIIPIRDTEGKLAAYSLRDTRRNANDESKYLITAGFDKDKVLYNLHRIIPLDGPIIVVEGFKSVWRLHDYGIKNVVAAMGSKVTQGQERLLYTYATQGVVVLFDNDEAGAIGTIDAHEKLKSKLDVTPIFITETDDFGNGLDPADFDKETAYSYLEDYI
jgi:DNA primase